MPCSANQERNHKEEADAGGHHGHRRPITGVAMLRGIFSACETVPGWLDEWVKPEKPVVKK